MDWRALVARTSAALREPAALRHFLVCMAGWERAEKMNLEYHPWNFLLTPAALISCGSCEDPACDSEHWRFTIGWFVWSLHFDFSEEH